MMQELLQPLRRDIKSISEQEFVGMTAPLVRLDELIAAREEFIALVLSELRASEREFLMKFQARRARLEPRARRESACTAGGALEAEQYSSDPQRAPCATGAKA
jgi:hypothetical protein